MIDIVEVSLDIALNSPDWLIWRTRRCVQNVDDIPDRVLLCPVRSESVTMWVEPCFADRFNNNPHAFLYNSVQDCWNTQWAQFSILFGYIHSSCWFRLVVLETLLNQCNQFFFWHLQISVHLHFINSGGFTALIGFDVVNRGYDGYFVHHCFYKSRKRCSLL